MSIDDLHEAEQAIRVALRTCQERQAGPISAGVLVDTVVGQGVGEEAARVAMWNLIDRNEITLTPDRKLQATPTPGSVSAV